MERLLEARVELEPEPEPEAEAGGKPEVCWLYGPPGEIDEQHFVARGVPDECEGRSFNVSEKRPAENGKSRRRRRAQTSGESSFTLSRHSVLVKNANDGRSSTVEIPYSDIFAVARRELGLFQLTAVQSASSSSAPPETTTFDFWGAPDAVGEVCRCLSNVVEDRRYSSVADQETVEEVRRLRREAHGETLPGAQPDPAKESRRALLEWTRRQLYSTKSEHHAHVVAFHDFFPHLCKPGRAEVVAPAVQKFFKEIAESLELDWIGEGRSPDGSPLPDLTPLEESTKQAVVVMAVEEAITTPIAEPLLSAVKATHEQQQQQQTREGHRVDLAAVLAYLRQLPPENLAKTLDVSGRLLDAASARAGSAGGAWSQSAAVLSAVGYAASASAKIRGLQAVLFSIQLESAWPAVRACPPGTGVETSIGTALPEGVPPEREAETGAVSMDPEPEPQLQPLMLGADELLPIVTWVVVRSNIVGLSAMLAYVEQLLFRDGGGDGDGAFCLATFQQAMLHIGRTEIPDSYVAGGAVGSGVTAEEGARLVSEALSGEPGW